MYFWLAFDFAVTIGMVLVLIDVSVRKNHPFIRTIGVPVCLAAAIAFGALLGAKSTQRRDTMIFEIQFAEPYTRLMAHLAMLSAERDYETLNRYLTSLRRSDNTPDSYVYDEDRPTKFMCLVAHMTGANPGNHDTRNNRIQTDVRSSRR